MSITFRPSSRVGRMIAPITSITPGAGGTSVIVSDSVSPILAAPRIFSVSRGLSFRESGIDGVERHA